MLGMAMLQDFSALVAQGQTQLEKGRYETAEKLFRRALEMRPDDPAGHYYLGVTLLARGSHEKAVESLERASNLSKRANVAVMFELGTAYLRMDRLDDAETILAQAAALAPHQAPLLLQLGWVYYQKVEGEKAHAAFTRAVELEPSGLSYYYLALAEHALGNIDESAAACRRALDLKPDLSDAHIVLGKCQVALGQFEEARATLEHALELNPRAAEVHFQIGLMELRSGDLEKALERFRLSVEIDPTHQSGWYNLALVYTRLGRSDEAQAARARYQEVVKNAQRLKPKPKDPKKDEPRF